MWKVIRENPRAVVYAVLMHLLLLLLLVIGLDWKPTPTAPGGSRPIQAKLVDQRQLDALEEEKRAEQRKVEEAARLKAEAEAKRKAELEAKQKAAAEAKRKSELAAKQKAEAEAKRKAELAAKQKAEAERKAKEAARRLEAEKALQAELAAEQQARDQGVIAEYVGYIKDKVSRNWLRPPGSSGDFTCTVQVSLIPGGDVASARVVKSCGDPVLDRSVEDAVFKAAPLPVPPDPGLFKYLRDLNFVFSPA